MTKQQQRITIAIAARRAGLSNRTVRRYIQRGLIEEPLTVSDIATLRRIRRLRSLGVNLVGVEVILHMRVQIVELWHELKRLEWRASDTDDSS
jgi:MerR family transcriptional regulator/heat shock protein HspR